MSDSIPDGWLQYSPYGDVIENTNILPFKVPLRQTKMQNLSPEQRFTTSTLLNAFPRLKCVIDLTNTDRYCSKEDFTDAGVVYRKIQVPGHFLPSPNVVEMFFETMDECSRMCRRGELIGIHCTHGVNRSGYLICRYLIEHLGWPNDKALKAFENARRYPIERQAYLNNLHVIQPYGRTLKKSY